MIPLAQAVNIMAEVEAADPPPQVLRAARQCVALAAAGGCPPRDLMDYFMGWYANTHKQSRYGK